uniref:Secreted protein n=1 Tax=Mesocestoides corti TaxID=53468 RepID=A0A5K3EV40_MESCO
MRSAVCACAPSCVCSQAVFVCARAPPPSALISAPARPRWTRVVAGVLAVWWRRRWSDRYALTGWWWGGVLLLHQQQEMTMVGRNGTHRCSANWHLRPTQPPRPPPLPSQPILSVPSASSRSNAISAVQSRTRTWPSVRSNSTLCLRVGGWEGGSAVGLAHATFNARFCCSCHGSARSCVRLSFSKPTTPPTTVFTSPTFHALSRRVEKCIAFIRRILAKLTNAPHIPRSGIPVYFNSNTIRAN